jgi:hypothetical protein
MSRIEDKLDAIAAHARTEAAPRVDVTGGVLRRLRASAERASDRPMYWLAAGALATAAIVAIFSMPYVSSELDPLTEFIADADSSVI